MSLVEVALRAYMFLGMVAHKVLWEVLKRRVPAGEGASPTLRARLAKAVKTAILLAILLQCWVPADAIPILTLPLPAEPLMAVGAAVYSVGLVTAILGRLQLGDNWLDIEVADVMTEQRVVDHGIYKFIRHPIYVGDLLLLLGLELALRSWLVLGLVVLIPVVLRQAVQEEGMLRRDLAGYDEYCTRTKRFVPFLF